MSSDSPGFKVNAANIGFFMAVVGVLTFGWNVSGYFNKIEQKNLEQDMRLDRTDRDRARNIEAINKLTDKTSELSENVVKLTAVLESGGKSRKAELIIPAPESRKPIDATFKVTK